MHFRYWFIVVLALFFTTFSSGENNKYLALFPDSAKSKTSIANRKIKVINPTFLGNEKRNYAGNKAPEKLSLLWKFHLGTGITNVNGKSWAWSGAGWTGQPLLVIGDSVPYIIQGAYDHHLRKINALNGKEIWKYKFDDVIKGTGTIWQNNSDSTQNSVMIIQGSREGNENTAEKPSLRAISYFTGKEIWRHYSKQTKCYSKDVDGSAIIVNDTAYIGLENGIFTVFKPDAFQKNSKDGKVNPKIIEEHLLYNETDIQAHRSDLVTESSPALLNNRIYITSGSGHVYGYNLRTRKIDWDLYIGADLNGSPVVTSDNCILVTIEKQYIKGNGGVVKINPSQDPENSVEWFFPTDNIKYAEWNGGIIGSASCSDFITSTGDTAHLAAFSAIDGNLYVVNHTKTKNNNLVTGFDNASKYKTPELLFKYNITASISTPLIVGNKIIAASYSGLFLFEINKDLKIKLIDKIYLNSVEATPLIYDNRIFIACRDGYLYCFGNDSLKQTKQMALKSINKVQKTSTDQLSNQFSERKNNSATSENKKVQKTETGRFYLISGSFAIEQNAVRYLSTMTNKGYKAKIIKNNDLHAVSIFDYENKSEALAEYSRQIEKGTDCWILEGK